MPVLDPPEGGEEFPPGDYNIVASNADVELRGATDVEDVQQVLLQALPSNVYFHLRFPRKNYVPAIANTLMAQFAGYFNALAALPGVAAVKTYQDINLADQIQDVMEITVQSTSGRTSFPMHETQFGRRLDWLADEIGAKVAQLDAIESGH